MYVCMYVRLSSKEVGPIPYEKRSVFERHFNFLRLVRGGTSRCPNIHTRLLVYSIAVYIPNYTGRNLTSNLTNGKTHKPNIWKNDPNSYVSETNPLNICSSCREAHLTSHNCQWMLIMMSIKHWYDTQQGTSIKNL